MPDLNYVARQSNNTLDEIPLGILGILEDNHVTPIDGGDREHAALSTSGCR